MNGNNVSVLDSLTNEQEVLDLLGQWEQFADERSELHGKARRYYKLLNYSLAIPAILLTTVAGTGNIGLSTSMCDDTALSIAFGAMGIVAASLFSIHRYVNIPELQQTHDFFGDEFYKLGNEIRLNIVIRHDERRTFASVIELSKSIKKNFDICVAKAPALPWIITTRETARKGCLRTMITKVASSESTASSMDVR